MNRPAEKPAWFDDAAKLADAIVERVGKTIVLALPLGLGKANHIANALYAKACTDPSVHLTIFTALTLEPPAARSELEQRFLKPFAARIFAGYPALAYANAVHARTLPPNVTVNEFFFEAGHWLGSPYAQQNYISANYTHALHYVLDRGVNVVAQLVAPHESGSAPRFSLSCNPDLTVDLLALRRAGRVDFLFAGETNSELPFIGGDAAVGADEFDMMLDNPALDFPLFAPPREPITLADYAAGLHAATLVPDGGTLQIGIGSLGEAVAQGLVLRHRNNAEFLDLIGRLPRQRLSSSGIHDGPFERGLYACTEMFVESLLDLFHAGVLKREVDGAVLDAGFFVGSRAFYRTLREMAPEIAAKFRMRSISYVNELYDDGKAKRRARTDARFINNAMMATLLGAIVSDGLEDGRIVSGVGGQYNFVAQGFALEGARSIIMLHATRLASGKKQSNIRWNYGHTTIPRHLRDMVVTEYGVADLRGKTDRDVIVAMLSVADSRFQGELLRQAKDAGKIERSYEIPAAMRDNTPDGIARALKPAQEKGLLPAFPFDTDFTEVEQELLPTLQVLKEASRWQLAGFAMHGLVRSQASCAALERLGLAAPRSLTERFYAALVRGAIHSLQRKIAS